MCSLSLLQGIFPTQGSNPGLPHRRQILYQLSYEGSPIITMLYTAAAAAKSLQSCLTLHDYQASSMGVSRQEYWSGLPFPSPVHESEKQKGSPSNTCKLLNSGKTIDRDLGLPL